MASIKWEFDEAEELLNGEVAIFRTSFIDQNDAAFVFKKVTEFWNETYEPLDANDLSDDELEASEKEGRWIIGRNCYWPFVEFDPIIVYHTPDEILDPDAMQYSFDRRYTIVLPFFDNARATHFKLRYCDL